MTKSEWSSDRVGTAPPSGNAMEPAASGAAPVGMPKPADSGLPSPPVASRPLMRWTAGIGTGLLAYLGIGELIEVDGAANVAGSVLARPDVLHDLFIMVAVAAAFGIVLVASRRQTSLILAVLALSAVGGALWFDATRPPTPVLATAENPETADGGDFPDPVPVNVEFLAGRHKNPDSMCLLGSKDYALAVGGTWRAPTLQFFASGSPGTSADPAPVPARENCDSAADSTWTTPFGAGQVVIWRLR